METQENKNLEVNISENILDAFTGRNIEGNTGIYGRGPEADAYSEQFLKMFYYALHENVTPEILETPINEHRMWEALHSAISLTPGIIREPNQDAAKSIFELDHSPIDHGRVERMDIARWQLESANIISSGRYCKDTEIITGAPVYEWVVVRHPEETEKEFKKRAAHCDKTLLEYFTGKKHAKSGPAAELLDSFNTLSQKRRSRPALDNNSLDIASVEPKTFLRNLWIS